MHGGPSLAVDLRRESRQSLRPWNGDPHAVSVLSGEALKEPITAEGTSVTAVCLEEPDQSSL